MKLNIKIVFFTFKDQDNSDMFYLIDTNISLL